MKRTLEPELMEDPEQSLAYSNAHFSTTNNLFVDYILNHTNRKIKKVLDLGCGPADIDIELVQRLNTCDILAIDGSQAMVDIAREKIKTAQLRNRITILQGIIPNLNIKENQLDAIISKDLLHHIPDPEVFWKTIERFANPQTNIFVMDLLRPESKEEAQKIVRETSSNEPELLQTDFYNSLLAAFTIEEIKSQLQNTSFKYQIEKLGDRHFMLTCWKE